MEDKVSIRSTAYYKRKAEFAFRKADLAGKDKPLLEGIAAWLWLQFNVSTKVCGLVG